MGTGAHSQPHARITTKLFCFSGNVENRRVVLTIPPALGAGGLRFKSGRPDQNISRVFFRLMKAPFTKNSSVEFWQTGGLDSQVFYFRRFRKMTIMKKHGEQGVFLKNY